MEPTKEPTKEPTPKLPKEPAPGLLMSMALRYDHALGCPGYYDELGGKGEHQRRLDAALTLMRQLYEEVSGHGFYRPESKDKYVRALTEQGGRTSGATAAPEKKRVARPTVRTLAFYGHKEFERELFAIVLSAITGWPGIALYGGPDGTTCHCTAVERPDGQVLSIYGVLEREVLAQEWRIDNPTWKRADLTPCTLVDVNKFLLHARLVPALNAIKKFAAHLELEGHPNIGQPVALELVEKDGGVVITDARVLGPQPEKQKE